MINIGSSTTITSSVGRNSSAASATASLPLPPVALPLAARARAFDIQCVIRHHADHAQSSTSTSPSRRPRNEIFVMLSSLKNICGAFNDETKRLFSPVFGSRASAALVVNGWSNGMVPLCFAMACLSNRGVDACNLHALELKDYHTQLGRLSSRVFSLLDVDVTGTGGDQRHDIDQAAVVGDTSMGATSTASAAASRASAGCALVLADASCASSSTLTAKRASSSSSDLRATETKCARTTAPTVDESSSDSGAQADLADADRDSDVSDSSPVTPIDVAQHVNDLFSLFIGASPEAMQILESRLGLTPQTGSVTPAQLVDVSCAKVTLNLQALLQLLPKERYVAGAMTAAEIEEFSEMASGALAASGASDTMLLELSTLMLFAIPGRYWRDSAHPIAQLGTQCYESATRLLDEFMDRVTSFVNGLEGWCDSDAKRHAFRNTIVMAACKAGAFVVNWCARAASAFGAKNRDIAIEIFFKSSVHTLEVFAADLYNLDRDDALLEVVELSVMRLGLVNYAALSFLPHNVRQRAYTVWLSQHEREDIQIKYLAPCWRARPCCHCRAHTSNSLCRYRRLTANFVRAAHFGARVNNCNTSFYSNQNCASGERRQCAMISEQ